MSVNPLAGKPAPRELLVNLPRLMTAYYALEPDPSDPGQRVAFGTSGHRGGSLKASFNEAHILAISQAIADYRKQAGIAGPLFVGEDTHALSEAAMITAVEVFAANGLEIVLAKDGEYTPTPVISHAILSHNRGKGAVTGDGVVITPSHNPPQDGGFKYNPPNGGPADTDVTGMIQDAANKYLENGLNGIKRLGYQKALHAPGTHFFDYITPYVNDLEQIIEFEPIRRAELKLGVDPLGGSGVNYWEHIARTHGLKLEMVSREVDPAFGFMTLDWDGKIRMDCSSPYAMAKLIGLKDSFDLAFGNDPDYDRHGIVTPKGGLLNPNHYLAVAVWYLFRHRPNWRHDAKVGKTLVSSSLIDRVAADLGRQVAEVPVGFKWFVSGLLDGSYGFGGEESAGASFLRKNGEVWSTDKDGIIMDLLAAEITAVTGRDLADIFGELCAKFGKPYYERIDAAATAARKKALSSLSPEMITADELAGEKIIAKLSKAPANQAAIGGVKVVSENGWFAARPSGTEDVYKIYAESFKGEEHLRRIQEEAKAMVDAAFNAAGV